MTYLKLVAGVTAPLLTLGHASTSSQWALSYLNASSAWEITQGAHVTVAVVDSGVSPRLEVNTRSGADFSAGSNYSIGNGLTDVDADGHGTGMASLIAGRPAGSLDVVGLAPQATVMSVRAYGTNTAQLAFGLAPAIMFAATNGAQVINLSLVEPADESALRSAIRTAVANDVVIVAGVGNDGNSTQYYPAAYPGVLGVGAIDRNGNVWAQSNTGADVGLVAPGVDIYRDDNQGRQGYSDGTSEATAYVSAAAALVRSAHPTWTAPQVVAALIATADKPAAMHGAVRTDSYGYGILNVLAALRLSEPPPVGVTASPDPVKSASDSKAAERGRSPGQVAMTFGIVGGVLAAAAVGLATLGLRRRRAASRRRQ